jgi:glycosyltransferase involved in cell wall biosynthesis
VLLEAMACSVPALALAVGGIPEVLAAEPAALLPADATPTHVARCLHLLLDSPTACAQLQKRQATYAATHFAESHMAEATLAFYQEVIRHFRAVGQVAEPAVVPPRRFSLVEETPSSAL